MTPEQKVEKEVLGYCLEMNIDVSIVDSKAIYSEKAEKYKKNKTEVGFSDLVGDLPSGTAAYIELKARGKLKKTSPEQKQFLMGKAQRGCFAVVVDSSDLLHDLYLGFLKYGRDYLLIFLRDMKKPDWPLL